MKFEVEKFIKPKQEDHDDNRVDTYSIEALQAFRYSRCHDTLGQSVMALFWNDTEL